MAVPWPRHGIAKSMVANCWAMGTVQYALPVNARTQRLNRTAHLAVGRAFGARLWPQPAQPIVGIVPRAALGAVPGTPMVYIRAAVPAVPSRVHVPVAATGRAVRVPTRYQVNMQVTW